MFEISCGEKSLIGKFILKINHSIGIFDREESLIGPLSVEKSNVSNIFREKLSIDTFSKIL